MNNFHLLILFSFFPTIIYILLLCHVHPVSLSLSLSLSLSYTTIHRPIKPGFLFFPIANHNSRHKTYQPITLLPVPLTANPRPITAPALPCTNLMVAST